MDQPTSLRGRRPNNRAGQSLLKAEASQLEALLVQEEQEAQREQKKTKRKKR